MTDPYDQNVVLLMHGDGANGGTVFTDSSLYAQTFENGFGNTVTSTTPAGYIGTAALHANGSGNLALLGPNTLNRAAAELQIDGVQDFTIEGRIYVPSVRPDGDDLSFFEMPAYPNGTAFALLGHALTGTGVRFLASFTGPSSLAVSLDAATTWFAFDTWHRVAVVRFGIVYTLYVNGTAIANQTAPGTIWPITGDPAITRWKIEMLGSFGLGRYVTGSGMEEIRFTNGVARYTANYVPAATAFDNPVAAVCDQYYNQDSLLLHFDGDFIDKSLSAHVFTPTNFDTAGTAKWGSGALRNTGNAFNASLSTLVDASLDLSAFASWTVEFWYQPSAADISNAFAVTLLDLSSAGTSGFIIYKNQSQFVDMQTFGHAAGGPGNVIGSIALIAGMYYHFAFVLNTADNTMTSFVNAVVSQRNTAITGGFTNPFSGNLYVGSSYASGLNGQACQGNIDDVRITKGVARYTTVPFLPPYQAFRDGSCTQKVSAYGKFVPSSTFKALELDRVGSIYPRAYAARSNQTTRTRS